MTVIERSGSGRVALKERSPLPAMVPDFLQATPEFPVYDELQQVLLEQGPGSEQVDSLVSISPLHITTLTQPRKVFERIDELADSIANIGLRKPLEAGLYDKESALKYLADLNSCWSSSHTLSELKPIAVNGQTMYLILFAGERRLRACKQLMTDGCSEHQEKNGLAPCYDLHHRRLNNRVPVSIFLNADYHEKAVPIQEHDNIHSSLRPQDLALSIVNTFRAKKAIDPTWNIEKHAKHIGRGIDLIRNALRYANVPQEVQDMVDSKEIVYGIAVELARLKDIGVDDFELFSLAYKAKNDRMSVPAIRQLVNGRIEAKKGTQIDLGQVMLDNQQKADRSARLRKVMARDTYIALIGARQQIRGASRLVSSGNIDAINSPLSSKGNMRALVEAAEEAQNAVNGIITVISKGDQEMIGRSIPDVIAKGNQLLPDMVDEEITLF